MITVKRLLWNEKMEWSWREFLSPGRCLSRHKGRKSYIPTYFFGCIAYKKDVYLVQNGGRKVAAESWRRGLRRIRIWRKMRWKWGKVAPQEFLRSRESREHAFIKLPPLIWGWLCRCDVATFKSELSCRAWSSGNILSFMVGRETSLCPVNKRLLQHDVSGEKESFYFARQDLWKRPSTNSYVPCRLITLRCNK